jgi:hypothetical protein
MRSPLPALHRRFSLSFRVSSLLRAALVAWIALSALPARAHRPSECTAQLRWQHQRLEAELVLSLPMASHILADPAVPVINSDNFPAISERLRLRLIDTFRVESPAPGSDRYTATAPSAEPVSISLTPDGHIVCALVFPLEKPAPLRVHAAFLQHTSPDASCQLHLWSGADLHFARKLLVRNAPRVDFPAPPAEPAAPSSPPASH